MAKKRGGIAVTVEELRRKDVILTPAGENLGRVDDVVLDCSAARVTAVVLRGRPRLFGLLGREPDLTIPWGNILRVGTDVLLVEGELFPPETCKKAETVYNVKLK